MMTMTSGPSNDTLAHIDTLPAVREIRRRLNELQRERDENQRETGKVLAQINRNAIDENSIEDKQSRAKRYAETGEFVPADRTSTLRGKYDELCARRPIIDRALEMKRAEYDQVVRTAIRDSEYHGFHKACLCEAVQALYDSWSAAVDAAEEIERLHNAEDAAGAAPLRPGEWPWARPPHFLRERLDYWADEMQAGGLLTR